MLVNYKVQYTVKTVKLFVGNDDKVEQTTTHEYETPSDDFSEIFTDIYFMHRASQLKSIEIVSINKQ